MKKNDSENLLEPKTEKGPNVEIRLSGRQHLIYIIYREAAAGLDLFLKWDVLEMPAITSFIWYGLTMIFWVKGTKLFCVCVCASFSFLLWKMCVLFVVIITQHADY